MKRLLFAIFLACLVSGSAQELPIRIDAQSAPRGVEVYTQVVDSGEPYSLLKKGAPAKYDASPGQRINIRMVAPGGLFHRLQGERQSVVAPAMVTIRLEKVLAWDRIAILVVGVLVFSLALFLRFRRRAVADSKVAKSQIVQLEERATSAEKVGSLARTLGDYEVLDKLGAGAMGVVYKVRNSEGGIYAAKVPNEMDDRVLREAEVSASLKSPNIVKCFGLVEGEPNFLLLEYLQGETVHDWLEENHRPSLKVIDNIITQLLTALKTAHSQGVYHRDVKPENLFWANTDDGQTLKVMDFGLASSINAARLTRTGEAMGTPIYASPEQLSGNPVDATTDLYSVGVLVYELATGKLPWSQTDPVALTLQKYKPLPQEPIVDRSDLPMAWNQLVVDLLQGDPKKRPDSVDELQLRWIEGRKRITR